VKPFGRPARRGEPDAGPAGDAGQPISPAPTIGPPVPAEIGIPPLQPPIDVPPPEAIPPAAPGEKPDKSDDTANVPMDVLVWIKAAKAVLLAEGFKREPLRQARKPGMVWGVIRQEPDDMQIHVRAFKDGRLETEHELSNRYVQHLWSHRSGAHVAVKEILNKHGLPTHRVSETFLPITGTKPGKIMPTGRTKTNHVVAAVLIGIAVLAGKAYLKRVILKRR
jgi:hypothetical protein